MGANNTRPFYMDPLGYERTFRVIRGPTPARMETALHDLSNIFFRIMLWAVIYQICHIVTAATLKWITKCIRQKKRAQKDRHAPPAERPTTQTPEIRHVGPTML